MVFERLTSGLESGDEFLRRLARSYVLVVVVALVVGLLIAPVAM